MMVRRVFGTKSPTTIYNSYGTHICIDYISTCFDKTLTHRAEHVNTDVSDLILT